MPSIIILDLNQRSLVICNAGILHDETNSKEFEELRTYIDSLGFSESDDYSIGHRHSGRLYHGAHIIFSGRSLVVRALSLIDRSFISEIKDSSGYYGHRKTLEAAHKTGYRQYLNAKLVEYSMELTSKTCLVDEVPLVKSLQLALFQGLIELIEEIHKKYSSAHSGIITRLTHEIEQIRNLKDLDVFKDQSQYQITIACVLLAYHAEVEARTVVAESSGVFAFFKKAVHAESILAPQYLTLVRSARYSSISYDGYHASRDERDDHLAHEIYAKYILGRTGACTAETGVSAGAGSGASSDHCTP